MYPSDLTDSQWSLIESHFDTGNYGRSRKHEKRTLVNAVFYIIKTGCQWRFLPKEYPCSITSEDWQKTMKSPSNQ